MSKVIITTGMRTGSTWVSDVVCHLRSDGWDFYYREGIDNMIKGEDRSDTIKMHHIPPSALLNAFDKYDHLEGQVITIRRGVKDKLASNFKWERYGPSDRTPDGYWSAFKGMNDIEAFNEIIFERGRDDKMKDIFYWEIKSWLMYRNSKFVPFSDPRFLCIHFSELETNSKDVLERIYRHIDCDDLTPEERMEIWFDKSWQNRTGRRKGEEERNDRNRKGRSEAWIDVISEEASQQIDMLKDEFDPEDYFSTYLEE